MGIGKIAVWLQDIAVVVKCSTFVRLRAVVLRFACNRFGRLYKMVVTTVVYNGCSNRVAHSEYSSFPFRANSDAPQSRWERHGEAFAFGLVG